MGCSGCGQVAIPIQQPRRTYATASQESSEPCEYTIEMLFDFRDRLEWFKSKALYLKNNVSAKELNQFIGIVITSTNIKNRCTYKSILDKAANLVNLIISLQDA